MPAGGRESAEHGRAGGLFVEMHGLRIELGGEGDDLLTADQPRAVFVDLAGGEIFPIAAGHGDPAEFATDVP